jgi:hypothetical protein
VSEHLAAARIAAAQAERDTVIEQARAEVAARIGAAEADRGRVRQHTASAEESVRLAQQEAARAETGRGARRRGEDAGPVARRGYPRT